jgi:hypothetical protein
MVNQPILSAIIRRLELYLLRQNDYRLTGESYDLILFVEAGWPGKQEYNLLLSARLLDNRSQREVIHALLSDFRRIPSYQEFAVISGLTILKSTSQFVRDAKRVFSFRTSFSKPVVEVSGYELELSDEPSRRGLFVRSTLLEQLKANAIVEVQFSSDGDLANQLRIIELNHLSHDMTLVGTPVKLQEGQVQYMASKNTFRVSLTQVHQIRPKAGVIRQGAF